MPNGGMMPCCLVCQWARRTDSFYAIVCQHHQVTIAHPLRTFCPDLSDPSTPGLAAFVYDADIHGHDIYVWIEIQHRTADDPDLPQYYHTFAAVAPIATYATWSEAERQAALRTLYDQKRKELERKYPTGE